MVLAQTPPPKSGLTFTENVLLVLITAVVVGLAVPAVRWFMNRGREEKQRRFEVNLDRDTKVIEQQHELLKDLSSELWAVVGLTLSVTYYKAVAEEGKFGEAWKRYEAEWFSCVLRFRALTSLARRLLSPSVHTELVALFDYWFETSDPPLRHEVREARRDQAWWQVQHRERLQHVFSETERVLGEVAQDVGIVRSELPDARGATRAKTTAPVRSTVTTVRGG